MIINSGKLIVIDGTDGTGKTTQLELLKSSLENKGYQVVEVDFPQYNTKAAGIVEEYLSGKYGSANEVSPYQASIFYAVDRYDASFAIKKHLKEGKIVLSNRYVSSNMGHQGGKIDNPLERKMFFNWLYELEYKIFDLPKPDLSLILYLEAETAQTLAKNRKREDWTGKKQDIHEDNIEHLEKSAKIFKEISQSFPGFKLINCSFNKQIMSRADIHYLISSQVEKILNTKQNNSSKSLELVGNILTVNSKINGFQEVKIPEQIKKIDSLEVPFEKLNKESKKPEKAHQEDAGLDLFANEDYSIPPYQQALIKTGIKLAIPNGYVGLIWDKSGLATQGYTTMGGVIDANYRGEIKVIFKNLSEDIAHIKKGQKIAQLLIQKIEKVNLVEKNIDNNTDRQEKGFGSSGQY